jgi:HEAT repeat protein
MAQPSDADVVRALVEIEHATAGDAAQPASPVLTPATVEPPSLYDQKAVVILFLIGVALLTLLLAYSVQFVGRKISSSWATRSRVIRADTPKLARNRAAQAEAEEILTRLAAGDAAAADQVLSRSASWTGQTVRTPQVDQILDAALNSHDVSVRQAAIQAELAVNGVPADEAGLNMLRESVGNPTQRGWALWMLGALGNRGVDPTHTAKIVGSYLSDPDVNIRSNAVQGLSLIATDETVPMLLDRFRNDPSPVVQEAAACALAESGMYSHAQRMVAAGSLVSWLNDSLLSAPQREWTLHALQDISGQNLGTDSAAWRQWYDSAR